MSNSALEVAEYVIHRCHKLGHSISNLKLQKILYFLQAEFLVAKNKPCFDETIAAWDFGPVVSKVYYYYKVYGAAGIPSGADKVSCPFNEKDKIIADNMINECAQYSAAELTEITLHQTPWRIAYDAHKPISNEDIKTFFE